MIKLVNLSKQYIKDFYTIYNLNLDITTNTLFLDNGFAGVSLFRLIAKIDKPTSGNIFIDDTPIYKIKDKDLDLAYLPSEPVLFKNKDVYKNLIYPLILRKYNKKQAKNMVIDAIFNYKLENLPKKLKHATLSEQKIVALIRAILHKPKYLLLENFLENLEEEHITLAKNILNEIAPTTTILVCEKTANDFYKNFNKIDINLGSVNTTQN